MLRPTLAALTLVMTTTAAPPALAQTTYREPAQDIVKVVDAPPTPTVSLAPTRDHMLLMHRVGLPPVADLAQPMLRLAGERINPRNNGPHGPRRVVGLSLRSLDGLERSVKLPADADIANTTWSPDGKRIAFTLSHATGIEGWVLDVASAQARAVTPATLNAAAGTPIRWMPDAKTLICRFIPASRGKMPEAPAVPAGPVIQQADGIKAPLRTLQDMLQGEHDEQVFDWIMTCQLALIDPSTGSRADMGAPAIYGGASPSPDGKYLLIFRIHRPYSYQVGWGDFPEMVEIWDLRAHVVRVITNIPLRENVPIEGVQTGPRSFQWQDTADATLVWLEALDEGDPKNKVPQRDKVMRLAAPFTGDPREIHRTEHRFTGIDWLEDWKDGSTTHTGTAIVSEYDRDRRWTRTTLLKPGDPSIQPRVVVDRSVRDRYNDPGRPLTKSTPRGRSVVRVDDGAVLLRGTGASPEGDRPFLDRMKLADLSIARLWRCDQTSHESVVDILEPSPEGKGEGVAGLSAPKIITSYESNTEPPNYYLRDLIANTRTALTTFTDPTPELRGIKKQLVTYTRDDGVKLSATLYLPPDYKEGTRLPLLVWAYPMEFNDPSTAGQVSGSDRRFVRIGGTSHLFMLLAGYAIMDAASMPVVGDPETMNDTFVQQITSSAKAAIDKAAEMGVADPTRVGVGGHSYGAFMTANLLAHCDLFKAGVARSGAYNRTLTPFGFQSERRTYWEATDVYTRLSPFTYAHKIKTPLLMTHGQLDNNPGTFPVQSERLYQAIKGNGGVARLVMLPYESHGYQARESVLHVLAETIDWFDKYVKNGPTSTSGGAPAAQQESP